MANKEKKGKCASSKVESDCGCGSRCLCGSDCRCGSSCSCHSKKKAVAIVTITDELRQDVLAIWKKAFPDAAYLVQGDTPILTHTFKGNTIGIPEVPSTLNGIDWSSPLVKNALYGYEYKDGTWANWYEAIFAEIVGGKGKRTATEVYEKKIESLDILIEGDHYHWKGTVPASYAIHDSSYEMDPIEFSRRHIEGLRAYGSGVQQNIERQAEEKHKSCKCGHEHKVHTKSSSSVSAKLLSDVLALWKEAFPDAAYLVQGATPVLTFSFQNNTIGIPAMPPGMKIPLLTTRSMLLNAKKVFGVNGLRPCSQNKWEHRESVQLQKFMRKS